MAMDKDRTDEQSAAAPRGPGLSAKLLFLTILFVMVSEVLIYVPSIANFRQTWLQDRLEAARIAALVLDVAPQDMVPPALEASLLDSVGALAIARESGDGHKLLAVSDMPPRVDAVANLMDESPWTAVGEAFATLASSGPRVLRVMGWREEGVPDRSGHLEIVLSDRELRQAMLRYSANILSLSIIISVLTAALVYLALNGLLVRPMRRLTAAMIAFSRNPEDPARVVRPSRRGDEIGRAERELAAMQRQLSAALAEKSRLAALGLAVSKINHDLRNILASAQLVSDRLATLEDPTVRRIAPKLLSALDRAIRYTSATLAYGSAAEAPPERRRVPLAPIVEDVRLALALEWRESIAWVSSVPEGLDVDADPEQLFRILLNLARNAVEALESEGRGDPAHDVITITARREGTVVMIEVSDTGPGVPPKAREHLFEPFRGAARHGGTGLGLAIAAELARAHAGSLHLIEGTLGATFQLRIPDRIVEIGEARARPSRRAVS